MGPAPITATRGLSFDIGQKIPPGGIATLKNFAKTHGVLVREFLRRALEYRARLVDQRVAPVEIGVQQCEQRESGGKWQKSCALAGAGCDRACASEQPDVETCEQRPA